MLLLTFKSSDNQGLVSGTCNIYLREGEKQIQNNICIQVSCMQGVGVGILDSGREAGGWSVCLYVCLSK